MPRPISTGRSFVSGYIANGPARGQFRAADDHSIQGMGKITRADVADFMLAQLTSTGLPPAETCDRLLNQGGSPMRTIVRIAALCVALFAGAAFAHNYPNRLVRIIVPFPAGGPTDVMARLIGQKLSERLGQQFIVENSAAPAGNIGMGNAARSAGRRLHDPVRVIELRGQSEPLSQGAVRSRQGLRADHQGGRRDPRADRPSLGRRRAA